MSTHQFTVTHPRLTRLWHGQPPGAEGGGIMAQVVENHRQNFLIWHEEDIARREDVPAERIREAKRTIDRHNQLRNDAIEAMDAALLAALPPPAAEAPVHSESPGMMLDRLSILALREYHLEEESVRPEAALEQRAAAAEKLGFVKEQQRVLAGCLEELLHGPEKKRWFPFRACKLYNDPATNPQLRECGSAEPTDRGRDGALDCATPPSEPDVQISRIRLSSW